MGLGRDVGALPGRVGSSLSELPHELIRDGATLLRGTQDALDLMLGVGRVELRRTGPSARATIWPPSLEALEDGC